MIKLETFSDSDNDKHNKHQKYTLDEALTSSVEIQRLKWLLSLANWLGLSLKYQSNDCKQKQLVLLLTICNRKSLMRQMWVIIIYCLGHIMHIMFGLYSVFLYCIIAWTASKPLTVFAKNLWCSIGFYRYASGGPWLC